MRADSKVTKDVSAAPEATVERSKNLGTSESRLLQRILGFSLIVIAAFLAVGDFMHATEATWVLLLALAGTGIVTYDARSGPAGAGTLFVAVFGLFHAGLVLAYSWSGEEALVGQGNNVWVTGSALGPAVLATTVGCLALAIGWCLVPHKDWSVEPRKVRRELSESRLRGVGWLTLLAGLAIIAPVIARAGIGSGYGAFLDASAEGNYGYGTLLAGIGLAALVHAGGKSRKAALVLGFLIGGVLLVMGNRGVVIFSAVALVYVLGRTRRFRWGTVLLGAVAVLGAVSVLRQTRLHGWGGLLRGDWEFSPLGGVAEMGYSLYPVYVVEGWMAAGDEPRWGSSLVVVPLRYLEVLLGKTPPTPDLRLLNVEIAERVGMIGGSPIAEGLRNGGLVFVFLLMAVLGILLAFIQQRHTRLGVFLGLILLLPLLFLTRNSFAPVPVQWGVGLVLVFLASRPVTRERAARLR